MFLITMRVALSSFFLTLISSVLSAQHNYFVAPTGNNSNSGDAEHPWETVQYAIDHSNSFDTINLDGHFNEKINISHDYLYLRNTSKRSATLDATSINNQEAIVEIINRHHITIEGIELCNNIQNNAQGILLDGFCSDITIKRCRIHDIHFSADENATVSDTTNAQGIIVYGSDTTASQNIIITQNELYNCRLGYSEGIAINGNVTNFIVSNNYIHHLTNIGIDIIGHEGTCPNTQLDQARIGQIAFNTVCYCLSPYATSGGIYVDGGAHIIIENNTSHHNGYGIEIGCENTGTTTHFITVRNNTLYRNEIAGMAIGGYDYPENSGIVKHIRVQNNTFFYNNYLNDGSGEIYFTNIDTAIIENNIFFTSEQDAVFYAEGNTHSALTLDYNLYYCFDGIGNLYFDFYGTEYNGLDDFRTNAHVENHAVGGNPHLVSTDTTNPNVHLCSDSPAIDAGNPAYVPDSSEKDLDASARLYNHCIDIGCDEYDPSSFHELISKKNTFVSIFPNPATRQITIISDSSFEVNLYTLTGQHLFHLSPQSTCHHIDVSHLSKGIYILILKNKYTKIERSFIKN